MQGTGAELLAEHVRLVERLAEPAVLRDFVLARRLRRSVRALEPLHESAVRLRVLREDLATARELAATDAAWAAEVERLAAESLALEAGLRAGLAGRDRYDPYDVVVSIEGEEPERRLLSGHYRALAERKGWRAEPLDGEPGTWHRVAFAITGGEGGASGPWAALKADNGIHHVHARGQRGRDPRSARVTVHPDGDAGVPSPGTDWRIDTVCTRDPRQPNSLLITHLPTGAAYFGVGAGQHQAKANALRQFRARALADGIEETEPAYRFLRPGPEPVRVHDLGPSPARSITDTL
jgi:peptide chain release factor 1